MEKQEINVSGSNNEVKVAGRDIIEKQEIVYHRSQRTEFFEPKLDRYAPPEFPRPKCANLILDIILRLNLVLIGDSPGIDKPALCRYFSWRLREELSPDFTGPRRGEAMAVQEWERGMIPDTNLALTLRQTDKRTIFILPQIKPQDVGYDLTKLAEAAKDRGHYVIASADASSQSWRLSPTAQLYWRELTPEDVYEADALAEIMLQKLKDAARELRGLLDQEQFGLDQPLAGHSTVRSLSRWLKTPENISLFVRLLCAEKQRVSASTIERLIKSVQSDESTLELWYRSLGQRDQMLALGLSLFERLFDDQFFAAFEHLVEAAWHRRDESLRAVDYCDLDELHNFFNLVPSGSVIQGEGDVINIQGRLPDQRQKLFKVTWNSHRRQLLAALPVMVQLSKASVRGIGSSQELYGSYERRDQLRRAISDAISDIGLISPQAVEESLLRLAADGDLGVQAIAARSVARWRDRKEDGKDDLLIRTLKKWEHDTRLLNIVRAFIEGAESEQKEDPIFYIRATIALAVGYAAYYDPPNNLSNELCDLLKELADDRNRFVRHRFCEFTLPVVVRLHLRQLNDLLWEMSLQTELIDHIAWSLAEAHRANPGEVEQIIANWLRRNEQNKPAQIRYTEVSDYEKRLATIALTYGWIEYDKQNMDRGFAILEHILRKEESPYVRRAVTYAMSRQAKRDFEKVSPKLQQLMKHVAAREQDDIVRILQSVYFDQRSKLNGGDERIKIGDRYFDVWTDGRRQMTAIEKEMIKWVKDPHLPAAQQIATQSSVVFAKSFDQQEIMKIDQLLKGRRQAEDRMERIEFQQASQAPIQPKEYSMGYYTNIALWFASKNKSQDIPSILEGLFPEVIGQRVANRSALEFVMERWRRSSDVKLAEIARGLDQAFWWHDNKGLILTLLFIGVMALLLILYFALFA